MMIKINDEDKDEDDDDGCENGAIDTPPDHYDDHAIDDDELVGDDGEE